MIDKFGSRVAWRCLVGAAALFALYRAPMTAAKGPPRKPLPAEPPAEILRDAFNGENSGPAHIYHVRFARDGRHFLAAGDAGGRSPVRIYNAKTGKLVTSLLPDEDIGWTGGRFSPDGTKVITWGSSSPNLYLWEAATGKPLLKLEGHRDPVGQATFSPDGKRIVSGGADRTLRIWDASSGKELRVLEGHTDDCAGCFTPDGKRIISYSGDRTLRSWDAASGKELWQQAGQSEHGQGNLSNVNRRCFSKDGSRVLSFDGDGSVRLWDIAGGKAVATLAGSAEAHGAAFLPDGKQLVSWCKDKTLRIWDITTAKLLRTIELGDDLQGEPDNVTVSPDARLLLTGHSNQTVRVWNLATGKELHRFQTAPGTGTRSLAVSPDSRMAAGGSFRGWVYLWRLPHPAIVPVHDVGQIDGVPYLVSDLVAGMSLADTLTGRRLTIPQSVELVGHGRGMLDDEGSQAIVADAFPFVPRRLWLYLLLSHPRGGEHLHLGELSNPLGAINRVACSGGQLFVYE